MLKMLKIDVIREENIVIILKVGGIRGGSMLFITYKI